MVGSSFAIALTIRSVDGFLSPSLSIRLISVDRPYGSRLANYDEAIRARSSATAPSGVVSRSISI